MEYLKSNSPVFSIVKVLILFDPTNIGPKFISAWGQIVYFEKTDLTEKISFINPYWQILENSSIFFQISIFRSWAG